MSDELNKRQIYNFYCSVPLDMLLTTDTYTTLTGEEMVKFRTDVVILHLTLEQAIKILNEHYSLFNAVSQQEHWTTKKAMRCHIRNMEKAVVEHQRNIFYPNRHSRDHWLMPYQERNPILVYS